MLRIPEIPARNQKKSEKRLTFPSGCAIISELTENVSARDAPVAQLDRVTGYEPVGRGFESLTARQKEKVA